MMDCQPGHVPVLEIWEVESESWNGKTVKGVKAMGGVYKDCTLSTEQQRALQMHSLGLQEQSHNSLCLSNQEHHGKQMFTQSCTKCIVQNSTVCV